MVPIPTFGSHNDADPASSRPGSRYRYAFESASILPTSVSSSGTYASATNAAIPHRPAVFDERDGSSTRSTIEMSSPASVFTTGASPEEGRGAPAPPGPSL